jgi:hypothetical protein
MVIETSRPIAQVVRGTRHRRADHGKLGWRVPTTRRASASGVLCSEQTVTEKYEFIESPKTGEKKYAYPIEFMCATVAVSKLDSMKWRSRPESATAERREQLRTFVRKAFEDSAETYGYRRVHAPLARWAGRPGVGEIGHGWAGPCCRSAQAVAAQPHRVRHRTVIGRTLRTGFRRP